MIEIVDMAGVPLEAPVIGDQLAAEFEAAIDGPEGWFGEAPMFWSQGKLGPWYFVDTDIPGDVRLSLSDMPPGPFVDPDQADLDATWLALAAGALPSVEELMDVVWEDVMACHDPECVPSGRAWLCDTHHAEVANLEGDESE